MKIAIIAIVCFFLLTGCCTFYGDDQQQLLMAYIIRQNTLNEGKQRQAEVSDAVKKFQVEAVRRGFAYWQTDVNGNVYFTWITSIKDLKSNE